MSLNKIMLIDDNEMDNLINSTLIRRYNLCSEIMEMKSGVKAVEYFKQNKDNPEALPDLILLDVSMPEMDGYQFLYKFQHMEIYKSNQIIIYMLSSSLNEVDIRKAEEHPLVNGYLTKPFRPENLLKELSLEQQKP